tara:strand:- start:70 stop:384 length:315 start_codon:yes stop_codon:yes gene_type:complete
MENLEYEDWVKNIDSVQKPIILDVRTYEEFVEKSIPGAVLANILEPSQFMDIIEKIEKDLKILVYCRSGVRSEKACSILDQMGFKETYNLKGGILEWEKRENKR